MNPVQGYKMINFLQWVATAHPEIRQLDRLPTQKLLDLVAECDGGRLLRNDDIGAWESGFYVLFKSRTGYGEYDQVRHELRRIKREPYNPFSRLFKRISRK